jgi:hypothetical protein
MIEILYALLIYLHVASGFIALLSFWVPLLTRKGSVWHRRAGWLYTFTMLSVSLTAALMAFVRLVGWKPSTGEELQFAWFLLLLAIVALASGWQGIVVLRRNWWQNRTALLEVLTTSMILLLGFGSVALSVYGWMNSDWLLAFFPLFVGLSLAVQLSLMLWRRLRDRENVWRMREHIAGMVGCGITTITAFVVFAAPRLLAWESAPLWMWLLPTFILTPFIMISIRRYAR